VAFERGLSLAIGDALIALVDWAWPRMGRQVDGLLEHVADVVRPEPPLTIRSLEGHLLTGLIIADRGQVLLFIGSRLPAVGPVQGPIHLGPSSQDRRPGRFDDDIPPWARDLDIAPYRRP
jgi:hypothetical protein